MHRQCDSSSTRATDVCVRAFPPAQLPVHPHARLPASPLANLPACLLASSALPHPQAWA